MPTRYEPKDYEKINAEISAGTDRATILVGCSLVEYALEQCIRSRLRPSENETEEAALFQDTNGILGTLSEKIWAAYFLKCIGPVVRRDLDLLRRIRNIAAHDVNPISFSETLGITSRCRDLTLGKATIPGQATTPDWRGVFIAAVQFYSANLLMRAGDSDAEIAEAFKHLAPYLDR